MNKQQICSQFFQFRYDDSKFQLTLLRPIQVEYQTLENSEIKTAVRDYSEVW